MNDPELLFNMARQIVIAEIQAITYRQWLPLVVGQEIMKKVICEKNSYLYSFTLWIYVQNTAFNLILLRKPIF